MFNYFSRIALLGEHMFVSILTFVFSLVVYTCSFAYGPPDFLPDGPHPRIWLTSAKMTQLRTKACVDSNGTIIGQCTVAPEWTAFINTVSPYKASGSYYGMAAWHFALAYVITKDTAYRDRAFALADVTAAEDINASCVARTGVCFDSGLYGYSYMQDVAKVYDWLYPELGSTRKSNYISYMKSFLNQWWNPAAPGYNGWAKEDPLNNYYWHHMFATSLATAALYGDDSGTMTLVTNGVTYTTPIAFWNAKMAQAVPQLALFGNGGGWIEGVTYSRSTYDSMFYSFLVMKSATQKDYFSELSFPKQTMTFLLHAIQPDDRHFFPAHDMPGASRGMLTAADRLDMQILAEGTAGTSESQWAQYWTETTYKPSNPAYLNPSEFIFRDIARPASNYKASAPLGYYAPGYGWFNWRTAWNDPDAVSLSFISTNTLSGHQHRNQNSFYLFYRDWQVSAPNLYEPTGISADGHLENNYIIGGKQQYLPNMLQNINAGLILAQGFGNDYGYVKGDATAAYTDNGYDMGNKILNYYYRSILTTGKYTVIYDRVSPKNATSATDYYLHFATQPTVVGNTATATNGNGMMFHTTLFPSVNVTSGADSTWASGSTGGYLKVTPQTQLADNYLLNVIEVAPSGTVNKAATTLINGSGLRGAMIADPVENKIVMFSVTSMNITGGRYAVTTTAPTRHYISDLPPDTLFKITIDGSQSLSHSTTSAGVLSFNSVLTGSHTYSISLADSPSPAPAAPKGVRLERVAP